jgi:UDP-N-acetylglucosamine 2-epimerase (non-hydrolysing)
MAPTVVHVVGARPNLVKMAPVISALEQRADVVQRAVHTGQQVQAMEPVGYLDFLGLEIGAGAIVADSGGVQEEASALGVPCFTLRPKTERPVTISQGTNTLLGEDPAPIADIRPRRLEHRVARIEGWEGHAGERAAELLALALKSRPAEVFA